MFCIQKFQEANVFYNLSHFIVGQALYTVHKLLLHAELCRAAQMKLKMAQDAVVAKYIDLNDSAFDRYLFDFSREEVRLFEKQTV